MSYKAYKDAVFPSDGRKYKITDNDDNTKTIEDVTAYTTTGSTFGTTDINSIGILECNYSYASNVHKLVTSNELTENLKFVATTAFASGDTVTFNGTTLTLKSLDGTEITNGAWKANSIVFALKKDTTLYLLPRVSVIDTTLYINT